MLLEISEETCQRAADFQHVVEVIGERPATACCITFFLLPKTVDSDMPISHCRRHRCGGGGNGSGQTSWKIGKDQIQLNGMRQQNEAGGAERTAWEVMSELEPFEAEEEPMDPGAVTLIIDLQKAHEKVQMMTEVWNVSMCFKFSVLLPRMLRGYFAHQRGSVSEGSGATPVQTDTAILPGNKFSVVLLRLVMQDAAGAVCDVWLDVEVQRAIRKGRRSDRSSQETA